MDCLVRIYVQDRKDFWPAIARTKAPVAKREQFSPITPTNGTGFLDIASARSIYRVRSMQGEDGPRRHIEGAGAPVSARCAGVAEGARTAFHRAGAPA